LIHATTRFESIARQRQRAEASRQTSVVLSPLLYEVDALEPAVFVAMSITMIGIGLLASYVPARRASNVAAIESLRND
jgi:ABC-type lipoprotein release transport system permease subunit